jgi:hypothetical protein
MHVLDSTLKRAGQIRRLSTEQQATLFVKAAHDNNIAKLEELLRCGVSVNSQIKNESALSIAINKKRVSLLKRLLIEPGLDLYKPCIYSLNNKHLFSFSLQALPIECAALDGSIELVKIMTFLGCDPHKQMNQICIYNKEIKLFMEQPWIACALNGGRVSKKEKLEYMNMLKIIANNNQSILFHAFSPDILNKGFYNFTFLVAEYLGLGLLTKNPENNTGCCSVM